MDSQSKSLGREQELTSAIEEHQGRLRSFVKNRIRDPVEAEDVVQDTFIEYFESYDLNKAIERLGSWLVRVAQNKIIDRFRRRKTRDEFEVSQLEEPISRENPELDFSRSWLRESIISGLELLPEEQREVFVLNEIEGKTFEEIAAATGVNINTLLARKRYAVTFLREYLAEVSDEYG